jgi:hypothetical protein
MSRVRSALLLGAVLALGAGRPHKDDAPPFPTQDPKRWIGDPVSLRDLRGRVVLLEVWTFGCENCVASVPWVRQAFARYAPRGLSAVGIHTPEFPFEYDRAAVERHVRQHGLSFPQFIDNDHAYWNALGNEYWPAFYLIDRCGRIRARAVGELHTGERRALSFEQTIDALLEEREAECDPAR